MSSLGHTTNINSEGDVNNASGGSTSIFNKNIYSSEEFFESWEIKFEEEYLENSIKENALEKIAREHTLILNDSGNTILSQYIAYSIKKSVIKGKRWSPDLITQEFIINFQKEKKESVFLLYGDFPHNFYESLPRLIEATHDKKHYVIVSTDTPFNDIKIGDHIKQSLSNIYIDSIQWSAEYISNKIYKKIKKDNNLFNSKIGREIETSKTICGVSLEYISKKLDKLEYIDLLIYELKNKSPENEENVNEIIEFIKKEVSSNGLREWYNYILDEREKLLAIALSFFEGLSDDQFFSAMEILTENSWRKRDPFFKSVDFIDFEKLQSYYSLYPTISCHSLDMRSLVLDYAWFTHRRQIFSSLDVLNYLVKHSLKGGNNELYGNEKKRIQIRDSISNALTSITIVALKNNTGIVGSPIEEALLQLAADDAVEIQQIVGWTLASWVKHGYSNEFFEIITNWQEQSSVVEFLRRLFSNETKEEQHKNPLAFIRATVLLSLGFSSLYMTELDANLLERLNKFLKDPNYFVRTRFNAILPVIVKFHFEKMEDFLLEAISYIDLRNIIGYSISTAYLVSPEEVIKKIEYWYQEVNKNKPKLLNKEKITRREAVCAVVAISYGYFDYEAYENLTIEDGVKRIRKILDEEKHPYIRKEAILAIINLTGNKKFDEVESVLQSVLSSISANESDEIIIKFLEMYLDQRQDLKNPEDYIKIIIEYEKNYKQEYEIGIWIDFDRPLTNIEIILKRWIKTGKNAISRQIALRAFTKFADTVGWKEKERIDHIKLQRKEAEEKRKERKETEESQLNLSDQFMDIILSLFSDFWEVISKLSSKFLQGAYSFSADLPDRKHFGIIKDLLPEALTQKRINYESIKFVLEEWEEGNDSEFASIAKKLKRGLFISSYGLAIGIAVFILWFLFY